MTDIDLRLATSEGGATSSRIVVRTRAQGMLSALAHDLELVTKDFSIAACVSRGEGPVTCTARLEIAPRSLRVVGALKGGRVDSSVLKPSDHADIEAKIQNDIFRGLAIVATLRETRLELPRPGASRDLQLDADVQVVSAAPCRLRATLALEGAGLGAPDARLRVDFSGVVKLSALGLGPVKGPLGAFRLADEIAVEGRLELAG